MSVPSAIRIIEYLGACTKETIHVEMQGFEKTYEALDQFVISPTFFKKDSCNSCGRCCHNFDTVYTQSGYKRIQNADPKVFEQFDLPFENVPKLLDRIVIETVIINGAKYPIYVSPKDTGKDVIKRPIPKVDGVRSADFRDNCHWLIHRPSGVWHCGIHPVRSITCAMPHSNIIRNNKSNTGTLCHRQYGRNWAMGCPIEFGEFDMENYQSNIYWLTQLGKAADDLGVKTFLPEVLEFLQCEEVIKQLEEGHIPKDKIVFFREPVNK